MAYRSGSITTYTSASQTTSTFSINSPVGVQQGDIIIIGVLQDDNDSTAPSATGFTAGNFAHAAGVSQGPNHAFGWIYKVATASEPASYTVTTNATFDTTEAWCAAWTGRNTSSPININVITQAAGGASPVHIALTGGTANANDDLIASCLVTSNATCSWAAPSGFTTLTTLQSASPYGNAYACYENSVAAGATGTITVVETGINSDYLGFVISLTSGAVGPSTIDTANSTAFGTAYTGTSASATCTVGTNDNFLVVQYFSIGSGAAAGPTALTYGGTSLTAWPNNPSTSYSANNVWAGVYYMINPPVGSATLSATFAAAGVIINFIPMSGVNTSSPWGTLDWTVNSTTPVTTVSATATGGGNTDLYLGFGVLDNGSISDTNAQMNRIANCLTQTGIVSDVSSSADYLPGTDTGTVSYSGTGGARNWGVAGVTAVFGAPLQISYGVRRLRRIYTRSYYPK